ncbi:MAG: DNA adenine methylase [Thiopseudomonas sp.]|nr:DNA adenine methylase [Thiopseudomonas sp.]
MRFYTPLRYPGGKGKLAYYVEALLEENGLVGGHYIEPYVGGAGVALQLLLTEKVSSIHINDADPAIYAFWKACTEHPEDLCKLIKDTPVTIEEWHHQREVLLNQDSVHDNLQLGFATFFLNRTNRSGILNAGVIGGLEQVGKWKLTERFNKDNLIKRIERIAHRAPHITVSNLDAVDLLDGLSKQPLKNALLYLDPPYYIKGQELYRNFYNHLDHVQISEKMKNLSDMLWIVSYDNNAEIAKIYNGFRQKIFDLQYTAQQKKIGSEIMVFSDLVKIPSITLGKSA